MAEIAKTLEDVSVELGLDGRIVPKKPLNSAGERFASRRDLESSMATGLEVIELPRAACTVRGSRAIFCWATA